MKCLYNSKSIKELNEDVTLEKVKKKTETAIRKENHNENEFDFKASEINNVSIIESLSEEMKMKLEVTVKVWVRK